MDLSITSLQRIELEARQAAAKWADINAACPYPWGSGAAITFKRAFLAERARIERQQQQEETP